MKKILLSIFLIVLFSASCSDTKKYVRFQGIWEPLNDHKLSLGLLHINKIQISEVNDLLILGAEHNFSEYFDDIVTSFFVCIKHKDHLTIDPSEYFYINGGFEKTSFLNKPTDIFVDNKGKYLYFLNTIWIKTNERRIFENKSGTIKILPSKEESKNP
jgi:hypothetical protein